MNRGKRSYHERSRRRLLELWKPEDEFGPPIGCVATTFTFDAAFFEEDCLAEFAGVQSDATEDGRIYVIEREEKLSQCQAWVIVDQAHVPSSRSLRWHVLTARVPRGIQHAKLSLLVWRDRIRVLIGSANLTPSGYRRNFENVGVLEFGPSLDDPTPLDLLDQTLRYVEVLRGLAANAKASVGPQAALTRFLDGVDRQIRTWPRPSWPRGGPRAVLLPVQPGGTSLFEQLAGEMSGPPYAKAWVQTPFFDDNDGPRRVTTALAEIMAQREDRRISFTAPGRQLPDKSYELMVPEVLQVPFLRRMEHRFAYVDEHEVDEDDQPTEDVRRLHAKSLWLEREDAAIYCIGSSNFTCAGTGLANGAGNYELNLAYVLPDLDAEFVQICKQTYPPDHQLDLDTDTVRFVADGSDRTVDGSELVGLPLGFGEANFAPGPPAWIHCDLGEATPEDFTISTSTGVALLTAATWRTQGRPSNVPLPWTDPRPPSCLYVSWSSKAQPLSAIWPVNVINTSLLPEPEELRTLDLAELLLILTSACPAHETMKRILKRRSKLTTSSTNGDLDPHRRIDTSSFLLQRMRTLSAALEGLRERLVHPVTSREALRWRLTGPFGPLALARRLALEDKIGAAFMISELAQTVKSLTFARLGDLTAKSVDELVAQVIRDLHQIARDHSAPPSLAAYVDKTFAELDP